jgi:hypothetical protein
MAKKTVSKEESFKVLKQFTKDRVYNLSEIVSLNNKKEIDFLKINKYIK